MQPTARTAYNAGFTTEKYKQFLQQLNATLPTEVAFRVAETPLFLSSDFRDRLLAAGDDIIATLLRPDFKKLTERAIPDKWSVANENDHPHFIARFWCM
jgi:hypothetical protein